MSFALVEANLLYIQEDELKSEFQNRLCFFSKTTDPLYIIIQLKSSPISSEPMITDLKEIRKSKAIKKVNSWIETCFLNHKNLVVEVVEGLPQLANTNLDFSGIRKISVYRSEKKGNQIIPLLKSHFGSENLKLKFFP